MALTGLLRAQKTKTQFVSGTRPTAFTHKSLESSHEEEFPLPLVFSLQGLVRPTKIHGVRVCLCWILCSTGIFVMSVTLPLPLSIYWTPRMVCSLLSSLLLSLSSFLPSFSPSLSACLFISVSVSISLFSLSLSHPLALIQSCQHFVFLSLLCFSSIK